jgi:hypothetical protein
MLRWFAFGPARIFPGQGNEVELVFGPLPVRLNCRGCPLLIGDASRKLSFRLLEACRDMGSEGLAIRNRRLRLYQSPRFPGQQQHKCRAQEQWDRGNG